jgi:transposase
VEEVGAETELVKRVAALDIGKAVVMACVRIPSPDNPGRRCQEVREYVTRTPALLELADWLRCHQVELVSMESTSAYWKPVFFLLEAEGFTCWLLNPRHVKNVPGRPKTDKLDATWLATITERRMCSPSLVHPKPIRRLRDLTRYRRSLVRDRTRDKQRLEKLLEDAQIKLSSVITDIFGVSGRAMLEAMIAGQRSPRALAELAKGRMRSKIEDLVEALTGHFEDHHGFMTRQMLDRIDAADRDIEAVSGQIEVVIAPFGRQVTQLDEITGVGTIAAQELVAELGVDMSRFPSAAHLVAWARFAPIDRKSAGRSKTGTTGKGNPWLGATVGEIIATAGRSQTFLGQRYRRIAQRRGKPRAIVAAGNSLLTIVYHLLSDPDAHYIDLGVDYYQSRINRERRERRLIRELERATGKKVVLQPAA